jgi:ketosteroid isomerase-like protein
MKKISAILGLIGIIAVGLSIAARAARSGDSDKQAIAALEQRIAKAVEAKDANGILANFAGGDSLVVFDVIPPLQYRGRDAYKKNWQDALNGCADKPTMEIKGLTIETEGSLAAASSVLPAPIRKARNPRLRSAPPTFTARWTVNGGSCTSTIRCQSISTPRRLIWTWRPSDP